jgi:hypothetical protein
MSTLPPAGAWRQCHPPCAGEKSRMRSLTCQASQAPDCGSPVNKRRAPLRRAAWRIGDLASAAN